eukprot:TRINITY_DN45865_c0_g1_i1.p1 TRINITY_DN45865_c0_g1~~TRINITY_DN45865_c0_g1_i1.p1  ORF type:complete len:536 (-),score=79.04 TRINITY_DN45865_c0_g1_i1:89-1696(-)
MQRHGKPSVPRSQGRQHEDRLGVSADNKSPESCSGCSRRVSASLVVGSLRNDSSASVGCPAGQDLSVFSTVFGTRRGGRLAPLLRRIVHTAAGYSSVATPRCRTAPGIRDVSVKPSPARSALFPEVRCRSVPLPEMAGTPRCTRRASNDYSRADAWEGNDSPAFRRYGCHSEQSSHDEASDDLHSDKTPRSPPACELARSCHRRPGENTRGQTPNPDCSETSSMAPPNQTMMKKAQGWSNSGGKAVLLTPGGMSPIVNVSTGTVVALRLDIPEKLEKNRAPVLSRQCSRTSPTGSRSPLSGKQSPEVSVATAPTTDLGLTVKLQKRSRDLDREKAEMLFDEMKDERGFVSTDDFILIQEEILEDRFEHEVDIPLALRGLNLKTRDKDEWSMEDVLAWLSRVAFVTHLDPMQVWMRDLSSSLGVPIVTLEAIKRMYERSETNDDGRICFREFGKLVNSLLVGPTPRVDYALTKNRVTAFWKEIDTSQEGTIDFFEFFSWFLYNFDLTSGDVGLTCTPRASYYQPIRPCPRNPIGKK